MRQSSSLHVICDSFCNGVVFFHNRGAFGKCAHSRHVIASIEMSDMGSLFMINDGRH